MEKILKESYIEIFKDLYCDTKNIGAINALYKKYKLETKNLDILNEAYNEFCEFHKKCLKPKIN